MKNYILTIIAAAMLLFVSCSREPQMDRTVFVPDSIDRSLPAYTEWGYNSFGAVYDNRNYFLVSSNIAPCKILYRGGTLRFSLSGILQAENYYAGYSEQMTLSFIFPWENITQYSDLLTLNKVEINLTAENCTVKTIRGNGEEQTLNTVGGTLNFKRAQLLYIDDAPNRVILSGVFDLRFLENDEFPTVISDGRFDLGINDNVFYAY
jgi:hypothetical protein